MTDRAHLDVELIDRYLQGDVAAFNDLMEAHEDRVFAVCLRMLRDREEALDATQDTFLTVFRKADRFQAKAAFSTWLYRVAVNTCYDHLRRKKRKMVENLPQDHDPIDVASMDPFDAVEIRPDIDAALTTLSDEFRAAVVLVDLQGMSLEQASDVLEVPQGTIKSRLFRARKLLAKELGNLNTRGEPLIPDDGET
ncbi:MAG: sigma-70 family RNA polymerase sigma factor [Acidimicrobiia bacterium]|nr:sigma-70 family RNA polymerase sigma factor [Acidimicrobiia bacterium]